MSASNDMSLLVDKLERRLGLKMISPYLPKPFDKQSWADEVILPDTMVTFSRYFPNKIPFVVNDETTIRVREKSSKKQIHYIKEELLGKAKLLGVQDIDWNDTSENNVSLGQTAGYGYYVPNYGGTEDTFLAYMGYQQAADTASLYNNNIFLDFEYPNKIIISRAGGVDINLNSFVVNLLVEHNTLATISPTKMELFESLAASDLARYLWMNLRYVDGLETIFVNIDLKLNELEQIAGQRDGLIDEMKNSYVSAANDNIPYIMTVSG